MLFLIGATGGLGVGIKDYVENNPEALRPFKNIKLVSRKEMNLCEETSVQGFWQRVISDIPEAEPIYVINAAGVSKNGFAHKYSLQDWQNAIDVNLTSNFLILRELVPIFKSRPGSSMVILSSVVADMGVPGTIAYSSSKSGLKGFVRTAAREISRVSATINGIELGYFDRGMIDQVPHDLLEKIVSDIPLKRLGTVPELFQACDFLLRCQYMTGTMLKLNGGLV